MNPLGGRDEDAHGKKADAALPDTNDEVEPPLMDAQRKRPVAPAKLVRRVE